MPRYRAAVLMLQQQCNTWLAFVRLRFPRWKPDNVATVSIANEHLAFHSNTSRSCLQSQPDSYLWQNSSSNVLQLASVAFNQLPSGVSPMCTITDGVVAHTLFFSLCLWDNEQWRSCCAWWDTVVGRCHDLASYVTDSYAAKCATKSIFVSYRAQIWRPKDIVLQSQQSVKIQMPKWLFKHCTAPTMIYFQTLLFASWKSVFAFLKSDV